MALTIKIVYKREQTPTDVYCWKLGPPHRGVIALCVSFIPASARLCLRRQSTCVYLDGEIIPRSIIGQNAGFRCCEGSKRKPVAHP